MINKIKNMLYDLKDKIYCWWMTFRYKGWRDDEYHCNDIEFIWGVKSNDDLSGVAPNLYTMNDIDITYCHSTGLYSFGVETAYRFEFGKIGESKYLERLLNEFTKFMVENNYNTEDPYLFCMQQPVIHNFAESIPELYTNFRIFVEGYKAVYRNGDVV